MSMAADTSQDDKKRDERISRPLQQYHRFSNNGAFSVENLNGVSADGTASAAAATAPQRNPVAASSVPHRGAPPMLPASAGQEASREIAPTTKGLHHPDLPFLVTHWLSQYVPPSVSPSLFEEYKTSEETPEALRQMVEVQTEEKAEALRKIRQAASNLASAFQTLEAFGHSSRVDTPLYSRPTSYSDLSRKYSPLFSTAFSLSHESVAKGNAFDSEGNGSEALLDAVVSASSSAHVVAATNDLKCGMPWSLLEAAREGSVPTEGLPNEKVSKKTKAGPGRRVGEDQFLDSETAMGSLVPSGDFSGSAIQKPIFLGANGHSECKGGAGAKLIQAAQASRLQLSLRFEAALQRNQMECNMQTLKQAETRKHTNTLAANVPVDLFEQTNVDSDLDLHRVVAQLKRRGHELYDNHTHTKTKVTESRMETEKSFRDLASIRMKYQDPYQLNSERSLLHQILRIKSSQINLGFGPISHTPGKNNIALAATLTRQYHGRYLSSTSSQISLSVLKSRLSHAATISCHLIYPVYCLKFDRTGKYFITGADDQVAKLFHLGAGHKDLCCAPEDVGDGTESRPPAFNYGANMRGAVLVCALRGHAGVVADIDVNVNNALLATASGDGDVRVWGLKDGCPVAILRGHKDGANMVSWSMSNPFRLATCGEDGLARMWDVSKAAGKRYGDFIENWSHYSWPVQEAEGAHQDIYVEREQENRTHALLPNQLQPMQEERSRGDSSATNNIAAIGFGGNNNGDFVANNRIDEGVTLIAQLQHGTLVDENQLQERVTRTGSKPVKVMCIARCAIGGHFATGSDDGLGRVWADDDDLRVERFDDLLREFDTEDDTAIHTSKSISLQIQAKLKSSSAPSEERLLATLNGHSNAVTDMEYSNAGDRILTASMKDGVVCVWSWDKEESMASVGNLANATMSGFPSGTVGPIYAKFSNISLLSIQLSHVSCGEPTAAPASRHKAAPANCDGVTWTYDDMKIVTSQSSPTKPESTDIIPGSQMIYIWDSHSGNCLMGIMSSHTSLCSTLAPHPTLSSVVASAGSDGVVNVWDLERGDCFCTHTNTLMHGPADPATNRRKRCGYLDVQFSPDGLNLLLTDENGRVTILDTLVPASLRTGMDNAITERCSMISGLLHIPTWMEEQYFANDYYDLVYDTNGYCIERGSELPPHLAPKGVRCTHEGISHSENIRERYSKLEGPLPLPEINLRWHRDDMRAQSTQTRLAGGVVSRKAQKKAKRIVKNKELYQGRESTAIITIEGQLVHPEMRRDLSLSSRVPGITGNRNMSNTGRQLSSRYRWIGFGDLPESEDENEEQNDEDYEGNGRHLEENSSEDNDIGEDMEDDIGDDFVSQPHRGPQSARERVTSGRSRRGESSAPVGESQEQHQPSRASSRHIANQSYHELNSDDEQLNEMMSTHTKPSGNFKEDWLVSKHFFKMPRGEGSTVRRNWVCRFSYQGEYLERKRYCPQVGDSVVYIPRAHYDTMKKFPVPSVLMPWKSWPTHSSWPVVCCKVTHIRYRFPYKTYNKSRCKDEKLQGVAAILSLEILGVPSQSSNRNFPWPAPNFISISNDSIKFEVTVFECHEEDFIIPECLYSWRIKELERAIVANDGKVDGVSVTLHCPSENDSADDADQLEYTGQLLHINEGSEDEIHFVDSGYNALSMRWDTDDNSDMNELAVFCAWTISVKNPSCDTPVVPTMGEDVKKAVRSAIRAVTDLDPKVDSWFSVEVDTSQYTDYLEMIEVPMHLSLIRKRLRNNYYTNKSSVVADMDVVKENCYKYNEDGNGLYALACRMYDKFKHLVDSIEEPEAASFEEKLQIHGSRSTPAVVSNNLETAPQHASGEGFLNHHGGSPVRDMAAYACLPGMAEPCAQIGSDIADTEGDGKDVHDKEEDFLTKVLSSCKPRTEVRSVENSAQRQTRLSSQQSQTEEVRCPSRRINLRLRSTKPEPTDGENGYSQKEESQTKVQSSCKPSSGIQVADNVAQRSTWRFSKQSQAAEAGRPNRRMQLRGKSKTSDIEKNYEEEESLESSGGEETDESAGEVSAEEDTAHAEPFAQACNSNTDEAATETSDEEDGHSQQDESPKTSSRQSTRKSTRQLQQAAEAGGPGQRSRLRASHKPIYVEKDSDEDEYSESSGEDENDGSDGEFSTKEEIRSKKRKGRMNDGAPINKRGRSSQKKGSHNFPDLERWPQVMRRKISQLGLAILNRLRDSDHRNLFSRPVCEEYPEIAEEYLREVKTPMDFHTIENGRLNTYRHIAELQDDLILTFRNCCVFNGVGNDYSSYALGIWQSLNDVFDEACDEIKTSTSGKCNY